MVRQFVWVGLILVVISAIAAVSVIFTKTLYKEFNEHTEQLKLLVENEDWEKTDALLEEMSKKWEERKKIAPIMFHKNDVHNVSDSFAQLKVAISVRDRNLSLLYIKEVETAFEEIIEFHIPTVQSVF